MEIALQDMRTFFNNSIIQFKNKLVFVADILDTRKEDTFEIIFFNTKTQVFEHVLGVFNDFQNVSERLGFVNIGNNAAYWTRNSQRQYGIGLKRNNTSVTLIRAGEADFEDFSNEGFINTLKGKFPSFPQALKQIHEGANVVAFDRQFAIDRGLNVFYRTKNVGMVKAAAKTVKDIVFDNEYKYLETIVGGDYEKNLRNYLKKAKKG